MSNKKKHANKSNVRKTTSPPVTGNPAGSSPAKSAKSSSSAPQKLSKKTSKKGVLANPLNLVWIGLAVVAVVAIAVFLLTREPAYTNSLTDTITVEEAYQKYQAGTFVLDVRTQEEWDEFHAPNTTHIPLDDLESRLSELPQGEEIVVICRSGNRSQEGRDILLENGFTAVTSVEGGLKEWSAAGYPLEGTPPG
jgi:rhodanese-related sulfurtransferase